MNYRTQLLTLLGDTLVHSAQELSDSLRIESGTVTRNIQALRALGLEIESIPGKGYRCPRHVELLNRDRILSALDPGVRPYLTALEILEDTDSTNLHLLRLARAGARSGHACLAERQRHGRGRLGRDWVSPFACNIYLSLLWHFNRDATALGGLSLAMGIAAMRALQALGVPHAGLKWPNDALWQNRKVAGILIDTVAETGSACRVVVGVGVNVAMPAASGAAINRPWIDMQTIMGYAPGRNNIAACLLEHLVSVLCEFSQRGFGPLLAEWNALDLLMGKRVTLQSGHETITGIAAGAEPDGALRLRIGTVIRRYHSGDVSIREFS